MIYTSHFFSSIGKYPPPVHLRSTYRINFSYEQEIYVMIFSLNLSFSYSNRITPDLNWNENEKSYLYL